jgi:3-carboxy-cis,cis-muconate cycloisomerase
LTTFESIFVPAALREAVSDAAWVDAMAEAERALAVAGSRAGAIPAAAAALIADACRADRYDAETLAEEGRESGTPAEPLVRALRARVDDETAAYVHFGATSQDIVDSAAMLVSQRALRIVDAELAGVEALCAGLAHRHRGTPMVARTLLQHAVPTTFGYKAAGWLVEVHAARARLGALAAVLPAQLGGAAGTLAALGDDALEVLRLFAEELGLAAPQLPWHTNRLLVADLGAALAGAAGACAKIGLDVALLAQTEVGEVAEADPGGSSAMPQKRNPVGAVLAGACARRVRGYASVLAEGVVAEHERAIGAWHAEWGALSGALAFSGGAAAAIRRSLDGLSVDTARMRANLDLTGGGVLSERLYYRLAGDLGPTVAKEKLAAANAPGASLRDALAGVLPADELERALDPLGYLGATTAFVDRALALVAEAER